MQIPDAIGKFDYNGAHLQKLASVMGLGAMNDAALTAEVKSQVGTELDINYSQPQPAGGLYMSASTYVLFLKKLLVGSATPLKIGALLAVDSVCTNPTTCPSALSSPIPGTTGSTESWHYGLAHWIEDDPDGWRRHVQQRRRVSASTRGSTRRAHSTASSRGGLGRTRGVRLRTVRTADPQGLGHGVAQ